MLDSQKFAVKLFQVFYRFENFPNETLEKHFLFIIKKLLMCQSPESL